MRLSPPAVLALSSLWLVGCTSAQVSGPFPASETAEADDRGSQQPPVQVSVTTYEVPEFCERPAGTATIEDSGDRVGLDLSYLVDWPEPQAQLARMGGCRPGNVEWPEVLLIHDRKGSLLQAVAISDLVPATSGWFELSEVVVDADRAQVPFTWRASNYTSYVHGSIDLVWDQSSGRPSVDSVVTDDIDWLNQDYVVGDVGSAEPERVVDGCSTGPTFPDCEMRFLAVAPNPENPAQAAVILEAVDPGGWWIDTRLDMFVGGSPASAKSLFAPPSLNVPAGCDVEMAWGEPRILNIALANCPEAGPLTSFSWTLVEFQEQTGHHGT